jgi:glycogen debranching enzyme
MTNTAPLNAGEPVSLLTDRGSVTLVDGTTFCISSYTGDVEPGGPHGLFFRDARIASRWQLVLDGQPAQPLSVRGSEAYATKFVLRRPPGPGRADSTLLVIRERTVGEGMRESVTLHNVGHEPTAVRVDLHVDADFADLFAVKGGRPAGGGAQPTLTPTELVLHSCADASRGTIVNGSNDPMITPGGLSWVAVVPPRTRWTTEIVVQPLLDNHRVEPRFRNHTGATTPVRPRWRERNSDLTVDDPAVTAVLQRAEHDLEALRMTDRRSGYKFVAAGAPWFMTLFGRDSLLTAWMTLPLDVGPAVGTLRTLAALQGTQVDPRTEEEPGRILHEMRQGPASTEALGGAHYFGTVDATPLFVMLLGEAWRWGATEESVRELLPAADAALSWMERYGDRKGDGFLYYQRSTDRGLVNQGWKDSWDGINDAAGRLGTPPLALCEVQGYAYAAYLARARLADAFGDRTAATVCRAKAAQLRERFAERFWLADRGWFAVGIDGGGQPLDALSSNPGHCLWTGIVSDEHAAPLIERLGGEDMDSGYGLRTLSTQMGAYNPMSYHNGSVWPHDTAICVAGLLRYAHLPGATDLANRLAAGLLDAATAFGSRLPELFCGFPRETFTPPVPYPSSCSPQAWASAAPLMLARAFLGLDPDVPRRRVNLDPRLPEEWGTLRLNQLRLGPALVAITAKGGEATIDGLPDGWTADLHD